MPFFKSFRGHKPVYIKIYGLPRSGTNYLRKLVELNFFSRVLVHAVRGKHLTPMPISKTDISRVNNFGTEYLESEMEIPRILKYMRSRPVYTMIITKNPYSWMISYRNYINSHENPNVQFTYYIDKSGEDLVKAVRWWNDTTRAYIRFKDEFNNSVYIVKYEDLIHDFRSTLEKLGQQFRMTRKGKEFSPVEKIIGPGYTETGINFNENKYRDPDYASELGEQAIMLINKELDKQVMDSLGYEMLSMPSD